MESSSRPSAADAADALSQAQTGRDELATQVVVPPFFLSSLGAAIAVQIGTTAVALARMESWVWLLPFGVGVFVAVSGFQLLAFRRLNGIWVGGMVSKVFGGTAPTAALTYTAAMLAAVWAAFSEAWWLVLLFAVAGGTAYALSGRAWLRAYRAAPAAHSRGESALWWSIIGSASVAGIVLLLVMR